MQYIFAVTHGPPSSERADDEGLYSKSQYKRKSRLLGEDYTVFILVMEAFPFYSFVYVHIYIPWYFK